VKNEDIDKSVYEIIFRLPSTLTTLPLKVREICPDVQQSTPNSPKHSEHWTSERCIFLTYILQLSKGIKSFKIVDIYLVTRCISEAQSWNGIGQIFNLCAFKVEHMSIFGHPIHRSS